MSVEQHTTVTKQGTVKALELVPGFTGRITPDGRISLYDAMEAVGISQPRVTWSRIESEHYKDVTICNNFQFTGQGQRTTPVVDFEALVDIFMLLPNNAGSSALRRDVVKTYRRFKEGDMSLATDIIDRQTDPAMLNWGEERLKAKKSNLLRNHEIKAHGGTDENSRRVYKDMSDRVNDATTGHKAHDIKAIAQVRKTRDALSPSHLALMQFMEYQQIEKMNEADAHGNAEILETTKSVDAIVARTAKESGLHDKESFYDRRSEYAPQLTLTL